MRGRGEGERNSSLIFGYCLYQYGKLENAAISVVLHVTWLLTDRISSAPGEYWLLFNQIKGVAL